MFERLKSRVASLDEVGVNLDEVPRVAAGSLIAKTRDEQLKPLAQSIVEKQADSS